MLLRSSRLWIAVLVATLTACSGEQELVLDPPPPPPPPSPGGRPVDPGLSFNLGCLHPENVDNPFGILIPPGSIPALIDPAFVEAEDVDYIRPDDLVFGVELEDRFYAFPARILNYHETATFTVELGRYAATWCPLSYSFVLVQPWTSNTSRRMASFMVSGSTMDNNLIMFDVETGTLWPQLVLKGHAGPRTGDCLEPGRNGVATTWDFWRRLHPETVMLTDQNDQRTAIKPEFYNSNPYEEYWAGRIIPPDWPVSSPNDRLPIQTIVLGVHADGGKAAVLMRDVIGAATIGNTPVVFFRDVASNTIFAFEAKVEGGRRNFVFHDTDENGIARFRDIEEGTVWSIDGVGVEGPRTGQRLAQMPTVQLYWFVWATFFPETAIVRI